MDQNKLVNIEIRNAYNVKNDIVISYRKNNKLKKLKIRDFKWYFAVNGKEFANNQSFFQSLLDQDLVEMYEPVFNSKFVKVYCNKQGGKRDSEARIVLEMLKEKNIRTYEADLPTVKRFIADTDLKISDQYEPLYFDIETDDTTRKIEIGKHRILSIAAVDKQGNEFFFDDASEEDMLVKFFNLISNYDVLIGWNSSGFDLPYIKGYTEYVLNADGTEGRIWHDGRMQLYGLDFNWASLPTVDMMNVVKKMYKEGAYLKSYSLESVSQYLLKKGKVKFEGKVIDLYNNNRAKLKEYNIKDTTLLKEIDEKIGMLELLGKECSIGKALMLNFKGQYVGEILDSMILEECHKQEIFAPSKKGLNRESYVGALVLDPVVGLHDNVYVFDYTSLYPSIILTSNIGFDTVTTLDNKDAITNPGSGIKFSKKKKSVIASVVERLVKERQIYKKQRLEFVEKGLMDTPEYKTARANEVIVKELSNSIYGIMGDQNQRYYSLAIAESITKTGHWMLKTATDFFNKQNGCKVIYGDTDSVFVKADHELNTEELLKEYHSEIKKTLKDDFNIDNSYINLKYEKKFESFILIEKKYYAGLITEIEGKKVNKFAATGIDLVKKTTIPIGYESQKTIIDMIFEKQPIEKIENYIKQQKEKIMTDEFSFKDIKITRSVSRDLSEYKEKALNQPHIKIAKRIIEEKGYLDSKEISYVVLNEKLPTSDDSRICEEKDYVGKFDRIFYWNEKVYNLMDRILNIALPNFDWNKFYEKAPKKEKVDPNQLKLF
jgi:DNA polymerase elongation subunit (family B)